MNKLINNGNILYNKYLCNAEINYDYFQLKSLIQTQNAMCGLSKVLITIDYLSKLKKQYEGYLKQFSVGNIKYYSELNTDDMSLLNKYDEKRMNNNKVSISIFTKDNIEETIVKINRELHELDMRKDKLNSTTMINIIFSKSSMKLLGLN